MPSRVAAATAAITAATEQSSRNPLLSIVGRRVLVVDSPDVALGCFPSVITLSFSFWKSASSDKPGGGLKDTFSVALSSFSVVPKEPVAADESCRLFAKSSSSSSPSSAADARSLWGCHPFPPGRRTGAKRRG